VQAELDAINEVHKLHYQKLKQHYTTQMENLIAFIEARKGELAGAEDAIPDEITSIIFEYNEAKGATPPFEDALENQHREVTLPADEYGGMSTELKCVRMNEKELKSRLL